MRDFHFCGCTVNFCTFQAAVHTMRDAPKSTPSDAYRSHNVVWAHQTWTARKGRLVAEGGAEWDSGAKRKISITPLLVRLAGIHSDSCFSSQYWPPPVLLVTLQQRVRIWDRFICFLLCWSNFNKNLQTIWRRMWSKSTVVFSHG